MSRRSGTTNERDARDPWRVLVNVVQIPDAGLHREIEADVATRVVLADMAGLREISSARASFDLTLESRGRVHVAGMVRARIGQTCVVTLDPIENEIDEKVDLMFAPEEQIPQLSNLVDEAIDGVAEIPDSPEPIVDGVIDLGRLAIDVLFLAIDPYPRKSGVIFESQVATVDPEDHPFAALKGLQIEPTKPDTGKPKGKR